MKNLILAVCAACALLVAAESAEAHHGNNGAQVIVGRNGNVVVRGGGVVVRGGNRSFFNQNGGRNRIGFRR